MNIQVHARQFTTAAEVNAAARALRVKLRGPMKVVNWKPEQKPVVVEVKPPVKPVVIRANCEWMRMKIQFDAHVIAWRTHIFGNGHPLKSYVKQRAEEFGIPLDQLRNKFTRKQPISRARQMIAWEIKTGIMPSACYPEIARILGGFDHSSIVFAVKKMKKLYGRFIEDDTDERILEERRRCEKHLVNAVIGKETPLEALRKFKEGK